MALHLPDFRQEFLYGLSFCTMVHLDEPDSFGPLPFVAFARYRVHNDTTGALLVVRLEQMADDDRVHFHFHIDVDRDEVARDTKVLPELDVDELKAKIEHLFGMRVGAYIDARYALPQSRLPKRGMIETLLGLSTQACGSELELRGSRFVLSGDTFTDMDWSLDEESGCIRGNLSGEIETEIDTDFLTRVADLLEEGIDCFVLENTESEPPHASDTQQTRKAAEC